MNKHFQLPFFFFGCWNFTMQFSPGAQVATIQLHKEWWF